MRGVVQPGARQDGAPFSEGPNLRIIDPSRGQNCDTTTSPTGAPPSEANLTWNQRGPSGPTGPQGARGRSITIAGGDTITIGGSVITVGSSSRGVTVVQPPLAPNAKNVGTVKLHVGGSSLSFKLFSWNFGAQHASGGGGGAGKVVVHDIVVTKHVDKTSPKLAEFSANGQHIPKVVITLRKAGKSQPYLILTLKEAVVSSFQTEGTNDQPTETLSLNFAKVEYKYTK